MSQPQQNQYSLPQRSTKKDKFGDYLPMDKDIIADGFGLICSAWCCRCGYKTMEIVRPGKVQCTECG